MKLILVAIGCAILLMALLLFASVQIQLMSEKQLVARQWPSYENFSPQLKTGD